MHSHVRSAEQKRARDHVRRAGYKGGGDVAQDKALVKKAIRQHEDQEHGGKHATLKLKRGGKVEGKAAGGRMDKRSRGGHGKHRVTNVIVNTGASHAEKQMAAQKGMQIGAALGARAAAAKMAGAARPPMAGAAPMGAPVGGAPRPPMPMAGPGAGGPPQGPMRRGGAVRRAKGGPIRMTAGAGSGEGRIEKERMVKVKAHTRRARGGAI